MKLYSENQAAQAAAALMAHQVLAFPTDTVYGVGVLFGSLEDLARLKQAKHRPESKPIPFMAASMEQLEQVADFNAMAKVLAKAFMPGAITLIVPLKASVDRAYTNGQGTIAVRIPDHPFVLDLISRLPAGLFVSSANVSGAPAAITAKQALENLPNIDGIVEGMCHTNLASTIVDCTGSQPVILRPGPIDQAEIDKALASGF